MLIDEVSKIILPVHIHPGKFFRNVIIGNVAVEVIDREKEHDVLHDDVASQDPNGKAEQTHVCGNGEVYHCGLS